MTNDGVRYFAEMFDDHVEQHGLDVDVWAWKEERRLAAVLHAQVEQFFLGLRRVVGEGVASRSQMLQRALIIAEGLGVRSDEGDPDLFDTFAFLKAVAERFSFDPHYGAGFAPDGSISILVGPDLPDFEFVKISGTREHEASELRTAIAVASMATRFVVRMAAAQQFGTDAEREVWRAADMGMKQVTSAERHGDDLSALCAAVESHFRVWFSGSESALVSWVAGMLRDHGLVRFDTELARAMSAAYLMTFWALHLELAAHTDEGTPGDWVYSVAQWADDGVTAEQLALLNDHLELGYDLDGEEYEVTDSEVCADIVRSCQPALVGVLSKELGASFTFAYLWAARDDGVEYPLDGEVVHEIVNEDVEDKLQGYHWVDNGMDL